mmetsp:Transcript_25314/g.59036  ORF Transcript_25314/g.59036 Transcript_25314/m.59036 type:complete len:534 (+) Transcript_25314:113-1714(+)
MGADEAVCLSPSAQRGGTHATFGALSDTEHHWPSPGSSTVQLSPSPSPSPSCVTAAATTLTPPPQKSSSPAPLPETEDAASSEVARSITASALLLLQEAPAYERHEIAGFRCFSQPPSCRASPPTAATENDAKSFEMAPSGSIESEARSSRDAAGGEPSGARWSRDAAEADARWHRDRDEDCVSQSAVASAQRVVVNTHRALRQMHMQATHTPGERQQQVHFDEASPLLHGHDRDAPRRLASSATSPEDELELPPPLHLVVRLAGGGAVSVGEVDASWTHPNGLFGEAGASWREPTVPEADGSLSALCEPQSRLVSLAAHGEDGGGSLQGRQGGRSASDAALWQAALAAQGYVQGRVQRVPPPVEMPPPCEAEAFTRTPYRCKRCGAPKRGHVCSRQRQEGESSGNRKEWSGDEDRIIIESVSSLGCKWRHIAQLLPGRSDDAVRNRWSRLREQVEQSLPGFPARSGGDGGGRSRSRSADSDELLPTDKAPRLGWTPAEDAIIEAGVSELGHRWLLIASRLPGRTDHAIRNRW